MSDLTPATEKRPAVAGRPFVVLLVDDQEFIGAALRLLLRAELDMELHCCLSAAGAVALANAISPTIILQDLIMPDIDGMTLVHAFRTNPQTAGTPVVVLSANDDAETLARASAAGAKGYMVKLPPQASLIASLRRYAIGSPGGAATLDVTVIDRFRDAGVPAFALRLIDQFLIEAGASVRALKAAAAGGDGEALKTVAHGLKGRATAVGASRLGALCGQLEDEGAKAPAPDVMLALVAGIELEFALVQPALAGQRESFAGA